MKFEDRLSKVLGENIGLSGDKPDYQPQFPGGPHQGLTQQDKTKWHREAWASLMHASQCLQTVGEADLSAKALKLANILGRGQ